MLENTKKNTLLRKKQKIVSGYLMVTSNMFKCLISPRIHTFERLNDHSLVTFLRAVTLTATVRAMAKRITNYPDMA